MKKKKKNKKKEKLEVERCFWEIESCGWLIPSQVAIGVKKSPRQWFLVKKESVGIYSK